MTERIQHRPDCVCTTCMTRVHHRQPRPVSSYYAKHQHANYLDDVDGSLLVAQQDLILLGAYPDWVEQVQRLRQQVVDERQLLDADLRIAAEEAW